MFLFSKSRIKKKVNLCVVCGVNPLPVDSAIIRLQTQDGIAEINVCDDCANFFDKSAEVLLKKDSKDVGSI